VIAYLNTPPPVTHPHLIIEAGFVLVTCIMSFRGKSEILSELGIPIEQLDTFYDVPRMEFEVLVPNIQLLSLERRLAR
jgi:hypothetical protein